MSTLRTISVADLPPLVYAHGADHDPALTEPARFRPIVGTGFVKPKGGTGLWTSPVTVHDADGGPADSAWLEWCRAEWDGTEHYSHFTEIVPTPEARVLLIDSQDDLRAIVEAHPAYCEAVARALGRVLDVYPDWPGLAAAGWDAIYLTDRAQWETHTPPSGPDLYGWDCASVLWLRPAYTVGRTVQVPAMAADGVSTR